jgi:hypothetical protein
MEENFSADQIREELRPRTLVRMNNGDVEQRIDDDDDDDEPDLIPEGVTLLLQPPVVAVAASSKTNTTIPKWKLVDTVEERATKQENHVKDSKSTTPVDSSSGLRQRKNKTDELLAGTTKSSEMKADPIMDEEEILFQRDPLELFAGVRPRDLKMAQKQAKEALESYIQAANLAALILAELQQTAQQSE